MRLVRVAGTLMRVAVEQASGAGSGSARCSECSTLAHVRSGQCDGRGFFDGETLPGGAERIRRRFNGAHIYLYWDRHRSSWSRLAAASSSCLPDAGDWSVDEIHRTVPARTRAEEIDIVRQMCPSKDVPRPGRSVPVYTCVE